MVFITTTNPASGSFSALGSFVYAMPNRLNVNEPLCTPLHVASRSLEFTTRVAKILAKKTGNPVYVGCSAIFADMGIDEEMAAVKTTVDTIVTTLHEHGG